MQQIAFSNTKNLEIVSGISMTKKIINKSDYSISILRQKITDYMTKDIAYRIDDEFLNRFLSVSGSDKNGNQDVDGAYKIYKNYYSCLLSVNALNPIKEEFNLDQILNILLDFVAIPSENPLHFYGFDSKNRAVLGYITSQVNPKKPDVLLGQLLASLVIVEFLQKKFCKKIKEHGMIMIMDHGGLNIHHYQKFLTNPFMLKLFADFYSSAIPITIHEQAVINEAMVTNLMFTMAKPFIAKEMTDKIKFYGTDYESIVEELGGIDFAPEFIEGGQLSAEEWPIESDLKGYLMNCLPKLNINAVMNEF